MFIVASSFSVAEDSSEDSEAVEVSSAETEDSLDSKVVEVLLSSVVVLPLWQEPKRVSTIAETSAIERNFFISDSPFMSWRAAPAFQPGPLQNIFLFRHFPFAR